MEGRNDGICLKLKLLDVPIGQMIDQSDSKVLNFSIQVVPIYNNFFKLFLKLVLCFFLLSDIHFAKFEI